MMNYVIFGINSFCSLILILLNLMVVVFPPEGKDGILSLIGVIILTPILILILTFEWLGVIKKNFKCLKYIGIISFVFSGIVLFAYIANILEAIQKWDKSITPFLIWFGGICLTLFSYAFFSGLYRIKFYKKNLKRTPLGTVLR